MNRTLLTARFCTQWRQGVLDVFSAGEFGAFHADDTLILTSTALDEKIIHFLVAFVFISLNAIPSQHKVFSNIIDTITDQPHGDIVPGHTTEFGFVKLIVLPVLDALKVHDPIVVEVLAWENLILYTSWMNVSEWMLVIIPSSKAEIDAANEGDSVVNDHEFFMVSLYKGSET